MNPMEIFAQLMNRITTRTRDLPFFRPAPAGSEPLNGNGNIHNGSAPVFPLHDPGDIFPSRKPSWIPKIRPLLHGGPPLFVIAVLVLALSGCAGHRSHLLPLYDSPGAALLALAATTSGRQAVTSTAKIEINHRGNRYPLKAAVMMKKPAFLRLESIPLMGPPDLYLSVAEGELRVFIPEKGTMYTGPATPSNISRFLPVFIPAADMIPLLMGMPPEHPEEIQTSEGEREKDLYRLDQYRLGRKTRSLWIDPENGRLTRFRRFMEGERIIYTAEFEDHTRIGNDLLPQHVTIRAEDMAVLKVLYTDLRQFEADAASFPLHIPEGITLIPLDP